MLGMVLPVHAQSTSGLCSAIVDADTAQRCADTRKHRQQYPLAELLDQPSDLGLGLALASLMIGAMVLRVGLR